MTAKPHAPATERNREPILAVLRDHFADRRRVLEIGSGTGEHAVHFAGALPQLTWQASDVAANLPGIRSWIDAAASPNLPPPIELDVMQDVWPAARYDALFSANTLHIMGWGEVERLFDRLPEVADADAVLAIYEAGIATGHATFQTDVPRWQDWDAAHLRSPRLVARNPSGELLGWCVLSPVSGRAVYAGVAEESVYVAATARGRGVGRALLEAMCRASEEAGIWTMQTGIFPENTASLALHEACGFRVLGVRERIGRLHGRWRDVVFMERRSKRVGSEP